MSSCGARPKTCGRYRLTCFLRIKLAKKHADLADLRIDVFYHRGFIRIPAFERQKFQAVIHNRSNAVNFSVVEAMVF